jgi:hypothetical protein
MGILSAVFVDGHGGGGDDIETGWLAIDGDLHHRIEPIEYVG